MALFSDLGSHCSFKECKQRDFLPFKCEMCKRDFCLEHRTYESHFCPYKRVNASALICPKCQIGLRLIDGDDSSEIIRRHIDFECRGASSQSRCPVNVCKRKLH